MAISGHLVLQMKRRGEWIMLTDSAHRKALDILRDEAKSKYGVIAKNNYEWRIIRMSDKVAIAYSKNAYAAPQASTPAADSPASGEQGSSVFKWSHNFNDALRPQLTDWRGSQQAAWLFAERTGVTGHGRPSRNRSNSRQNKAKGSRKLSSTMNIERRTPEALKLRQKWALQNKVNIPQPSITGAELLQAGQQLTVLPKLTRTLERRRAA